MKANELFELLIAKQHLSQEQMTEVIKGCMSGQYTDVQLATFLALMRMKGETVNELTAAATVMQSLARPIDLGPNLIDIVGTGGDTKNTFNVSTTCSFVVAGAGIFVAKHGNRSVSSRSGSADLLEQAGFILNLDDQALQRCIQATGLTFLFAPHFHPAMQFARTARKELGIRTLFNLLGPLINPAKVKKQVVGVFSTAWLSAIAEVLAHLGSERALVLSSEDGLDEISICAPTQVLELINNKYVPWRISPGEYGLGHDSLKDIIVESPQHSLDMIKSVLAGHPGAARDIVVLNSAAAIYCANDNLSFQSAIVQAQQSIDSGKALDCFTKLRDLTQELSPPTSK